MKNEQTLAERVVEAMLLDDRATPWLGMRVESAGEGTSRVSMTVTAEMINGHRTCHGGFVFALADSAFAFACNSRNLRTVAAGCSIDYVRPAMLDDTLLATAEERTVGNRLGIYDVTVTNQRGEAVAIFRGRSYRVAGGIVE